MAARGDRDALDSLNRTLESSKANVPSQVYYETFRFFEDLDFTIVDGGPKKPVGADENLGEIASCFRGAIK